MTLKVFYYGNVMHDMINLNNKNIFQIINIYFSIIIIYFTDIWINYKYFLRILLLWNLDYLHCCLLLYQLNHFTLGKEQNLLLLDIVLLNLKQKIGLFHIIVS